MAASILRQRAFVVRVFLVVFAFSAAYAVTRPIRYTSTASFLPESDDTNMPSAAAALASQFGVSLGAGAAARVPQFYADLITSGEVLRTIVRTKHPLKYPGDGPDSLDLIQIYDVGKNGGQRGLERATENLRDQIRVGVARESGVVNLAVHTSDPKLSQSIAAQLLALVNDFDLSSRQTQAGAERRFSEERLAALRGELAAAEDSLKQFLDENRSFTNSPSLQFEHDRLQRAVIMRQEIVTSMAQMFETARIQEVRNTPVVTLIEIPYEPATRDPRRTGMLLMTGALAALLMGLIGAVLKDRIGTRRPLGEGSEELVALWGEAKGDVKRWWPGKDRRTA